MRRVSELIRRIRSERRPFRFLASRVVWRSGLCQLLVIDVGYGRLHFFPTALSATLWVDPRARETDTTFFKSVLRPGDVAIDVGANIGSLTVLAARLVGPSGHVYAVEPNPRTYRYLVRNLRLNRANNVTPICVAAGAVDGTAALVGGRSDDQDRIGDEGTPIPMRRLDSMVGGDARPVRLLKVDVEGFEKFVLDGAPDVLSRTEFMYVEIGDVLSSRYGYSAGDLIRYLASLEFDAFKVGSNGDLLPVDPNFDPGRSCDLVARARKISVS